MVVALAIEMEQTEKADRQMVALVPELNTETESLGKFRVAVVELELIDEQAEPVPQAGFTCAFIGSEL